MKTRKFKHMFVEKVPDKIKRDVLYICLPYNITVHECACGCNEKVALPLAPNQWIMKYDGQSISLSPSIGNWSYKCKSHYFIRNNRVLWAREWSENELIESRTNM